MIAMISKSYLVVGTRRRLGRLRLALRSFRLALFGEDPGGMSAPIDPYCSSANRFPAPRTVIDVGGSHGQFAREILSHFPAAEIYSFEPIPECFSELEQLAHDNPKLRVFQLALSDQSGVQSFNVSGFNDSSSFQSMRPEHLDAWPHTAYKKTIEVKKSTLDEFFRERVPDRPIFLKLDVQGHEMSVLRGGRETLSKCQRVMLECNFADLYEGQPTFDQICHEMRSHGFRLESLISPLRHPRTGELMSTDLIFFKPDQDAPVGDRSGAKLEPEV